MLGRTTGDPSNSRANHRNGGELIDTGHKTMLAYANEFGLARESYVKKRGDETYYFLGQRWSETEIVDQFRQVVGNMKSDLRTISGSATFFSHTPDDVVFDKIDLASYFASRGGGLPVSRRTTWTRWCTCCACTRRTRGACCG